ncbi:Chemotaxis response regulator protein-glutamate methylesterase [BD1-7 clade bacterium]|uniref:Protein-glutamate methylesterase/protein-glutamine glutaminase n=1 Tax=BD1-7 clade bacterium TaxID=2029982 RepID=A0A5S9MUP8_9GAMM|nr:Chemotaxis response regulator protein-glutamate methylesterase [BD1-7 clade bacterium]CAA0083468.1 Chemotaxis response regulator protein-glutamate methylesterase [BD1-7 clade bacterium]
MTINVFIVDDSATARTALKLLLDGTDDITVTGVASNPVIALKRMNIRWPDVIISDLEMPEMDGFTFLQHIQRERPTPFIVFSNHTGSSAMSSVEALSRGAMDIIPKPNFSCEESLDQTREHILQSIRASANTLAADAVKQTLRERKKKRLSTGQTLARAILGEDLAQTLERKTHKADEQPNDVVVDCEELALRHKTSVVAIGSSTGGTTIVEQILTQLPVNSPPVLIVQHMPEHFTAAFAKRINQFCAIEVKEAKAGDVLTPGTAFIAPGGHHMAISSRGPGYRLDVYVGEHVNRHCPSVDVLFNSVADRVGKNALGIILTGMGKDGAKGLLAMRERGAMTLAQAEKGCAVYGMPKAAVAIDAVCREMLPQEIATVVSSLNKDE